MRRAKLALLLLGILWLAGWVAYGAATGLAAGWALAGTGILLGYGLLGWASYRARAARVAATALAAALTFAVAWISFTHLGLLAGGLAITAGCFVPPRT